MLQQHAQAGALPVSMLPRAGERFGFFHAPAQVQRTDRANGSDHERDSPAPVLQLLFVQQQSLQHDQHGQSQQLAHDQGDVLEAGPETAMPRMRHFTQVSRRGAVLAAHAQALEQSRQQQERRRRVTDPIKPRRQSDHQRTSAHQQHRSHQCRLAPPAVGVKSHQPATHRPHQETHRENRRGIHQLRGAVAFRKKRMGEIERKRRIDVPVVPLHQIAHRTAEDAAQAMAGGMEVGSRHCPDDSVQNSGRLTHPWEAAARNV